MKITQFIKELQEAEKNWYKGVIRANDDFTQWGEFIIDYSETEAGEPTDIVLITKVITAQSIDRWILPWMIYKKECRYSLITEVNTWVYTYVKLANWVVFDMEELKREWEFVVYNYDYKKENQ